MKAQKLQNLLEKCPKEETGGKKLRPSEERSPYFGRFWNFFSKTLVFVAKGHFASFYVVIDRSKSLRGQKLIKNQKNHEK